MIKSVAKASQEPLKRVVGSELAAQGISEVLHVADITRISPHINLDSRRKRRRTLKTKGPAHSNFRDRERDQLSRTCPK